MNAREASMIPNGILIALDIGNTWIGVAKSDLDQEFIWPMCTVRNNRFEEWLSGISSFRIAGIVVGWPLLLDGKEGSQCKCVSRFIMRIRKIIKVPIFKHDERLTSYSAKEMYGTDDDSIAAMILLQSFLNNRKRKEMLNYRFE